MPINITAVGAAGTHTLQKVNVNLEENFVYFPNRDTASAYPVQITDDSAWVFRETTGSIDGVDSNTVYFLNSDGFSVQFATTAGGSPIDLTNYSAGAISFNFPFVFNNSFNISSVKFDDRQAVRYLTNGEPINGLVSGNLYYVRNLLTGLGGSALYDFEEWNFTTAGVTGRNGPTINQLRTAYTTAGASWATTYLNQGTFQGYQDWTVPEDGLYEFVVRGAPGRQGSNLGGGGAIVRGRVRLTKGEIITIAVGQRGELPTNNLAWPASSGGTFVVRKSGNIPLFVAGGGSSSSNVTAGFNAVLTNRGGTSGQGYLGGDLGQGAAGRSTGGGGGGFFSAGGGSERGGGGGGFNNGLVGGSAAGGSSAWGGFGGGAGSDGESWGGPGGAGGYSGGATNDRIGSLSGGGGGSFIFATATNVATSTGLYNGSNTLLGNPITNLGVFNTGAVEGSVSVTLVESSVFGFTLHASGEDAANNTDPIPVTPAGTSFHALIPITYDTVGETINLTTPHGLFNGQALTYFFSGGTPAGTLNTTDVYYAEVSDLYTFKLSTTPDPNFTTINLISPSATSSEGFRRVVVNTATNTITIPNHGFLIDQPVRYTNGGGTNILPLQNNATYYIKEVVDANRFTLSQSLQGPVLDLQAVGVGTNHSFIFTVINDLEDTIYLPTHGYVSGQTVKYQKSRDFVIASVSSSGTSRFINTSVAHGFLVNQRVTFDDFQRTTISTPTITVTQIASSGQTRTLTLGANHNLTTGNYITVSGFTGTRNARFNGTFIVTGVPSGNILQYTAEESVTITTENVAEAATIVRRSDYEYLEHTRPLDIRSYASSGTTRTIVTTKPHLFANGSLVTISGIQDEDGRYFNGTYTITSVPNTNTFTYTGAYQDPTNQINRDPSITIATVTPTYTATVFREIIIDQVPSATQFRYQMPNSSFTTGTENVIGRTSITSVLATNRQMFSRNIGEITTQANHGLSVGDRFVLTNITGNNQDVFNGTYQVTTVPSATVVRFTTITTPKALANKRLDSNTVMRINTSVPHNLIAGNLFYLEGTSGDDGRFWDGRVQIVSRSSTGTTRTINTNNPHYLSTNQRFRILEMTGANANEYIGDFIVASVPSATQFTYNATTSLTQTQENVTGEVIRAHTISSIPAYTISARSRNANVADVTFTGNHDLIVGDRIRITNITGADPQIFNGDWTITGVPAANRITFTTPTSGTITNASVSGTATAVNQIRYSIPTFTRTIARRQLVSNTVALFDTTFEHQLAVGSTVTISGITGTQQSVFNGTYNVASVPNSTRFTVTRTQQANVTTFTVTNRQRTVNVCDVTLNTTHNFLVGNTVTISNMSGTDAAVFNGTHVITAIPAANRIQFFSATSGTISAAAVTGNLTLDIVADEAVSGTITLNTIPTTNTTTGNVIVAQVDSAGISGEFITNTEIPGLDNQRTYFVSRVDNNTIKLATDKNLSQIANITGVGIGTQQIITTSVDYAANTITIPNHGFSTGELVEYDTGGQTAIGGLTSGTPYYIIVIDGNTIQLATSGVNAENAVAIDLTTATTAAGRHKLKSLIRTPDGTYTISNVPDANTFEVLANGSVPAIVKTFSPRFSVNLDQNYIKIPNHGFLTGTEITYSNGGGTSLGGLTDDSHYYVIAINKDHLRLAETVEDADSGIPLTISTFGAGISHTLTSLQINGRVTGTGTVSTTVDSVLVNGSGTSFSKILKVGDQFRLFPPDVEQAAYFAATGVNTTTEEITLPNHGFTTGDGVIFSPGSGGPRRAIFRISASGTGRTIRTAEPHGYSNADTVVISGLSSTSAAEFNGTFSITVNDAYQFSYTASTGNSITISNENQTSGLAVRTGVAGVAPAPLVDGYYYFVRSVPNGSVFTLTARDRTSNVITFTTSATHNLFPGNSFTVSGISGVNPEVFNGTFTVVSTPSATQIQCYSTGGDIGNASVSGTLTPNSSNVVTLHSLKSDAVGNLNAVDFSNQGSGFALKLAKVIPSAPIVREITAIGSDTQITVDRAFSTAYTGVNFAYPTFIYVRPQGYSLHRPFDGGVEMSTGFGTWYGQIIRQTRKYFRYQSGKGIQTSAGINFKPSIDVESATRVGNSNVVAVRTRRPHGLISGLFCRIDDALDSQGVYSSVYNGTFQVTVIDAFNFTFIATNTIVENKAYGYPRVHVTQWENGALRAGMFDFQNGMFFEFDGQKLYAVRRSSTQQIAGTVAALQGSEFIFGTNTSFTTQLEAGDFIVLRGQTYKVSQVINDTRIAIKPEYKGNSGNEKEFNPGDGTTGVVRVADNYFNIINHGFSEDLPVVYNSIDGTPIGGLINGKTYYVDVVDNNRFRLKATPDSTQNVELSSAGAGNPHSFTPAKTGIVATLTEDTRTPQEEWSLDVCDGTGPTGYNLDLSKIQMIYMDYSWYGAGKIRYGFKTIDGQVRYVHEYVHNNFKFESYFRSGNLPARYEVTTFDNPTYIPSLFHWGTSVIMDGKFDDDRAYLFTKASQNLNIGGTTSKTFGSTAINVVQDFINIPSHGFTNGEAVQFRSVGSNGLPQANTNNPSTEQVSGVYNFSNLQNEATYFVRVINTNNIALFPTQGTATSTGAVIANFSKSNWLVTVNTTGNHGFSAGQLIWNNISITNAFAGSVNGAFRVNSTPSGTQYTYFSFNGFRDFGAQTVAGVALLNPINLTSQGNSQATYVLAPAGTLNNTSGANYQPLLSLRLSPSVSEGLTGALGDRDVINRMQLRLLEIGVQTNQLVDVKLLLNARLNNLNFVGVASPSLVQVVEHTSNDTVSGGVQVYNFRASGNNGLEASTTVSVDELFELSNSILGGNSVFPDGPDIVTIAVARLTGNETLASAKMSWKEAQA